MYSTNTCDCKCTTFATSSADVHSGTTYMCCCNRKYYSDSATGSYLRVPVGCRNMAVLSELHICKHWSTHTQSKKHNRQHVSKPGTGNDQYSTDTAKCTSSECSTADMCCCNSNSNNHFIDSRS